MRLTLRTLLAYLDDNLEPAEARLIGQKVAESEAAQELIARIKEVTRRRRITTPPPGGPGNKVDANGIAGYLDNALSPEELAEVEELALTSDVHLAEIAACHQILTIVLGEPAIVPPTAYKRMYGLVKPPESNPEHQPPGPRTVEDGLPENKDVDETLRLGLPAFAGRGTGSNRMILVGGAACILALLGVAIWQLLGPIGREGDSEIVAKATDSPKKTSPPPGVEKKKPETPKTGVEAPPKKEPDIRDKPAEKDKQPEEKAKKLDPKEIVPPEEKKGEPEAPAAPNPEEKYIGQFDPPAPPGAAVLLQLLPDKKQPDRKQWTRLIRAKDPARVLTNAPLVSLPGYQSVIQLDSGVKLTLWGNVPEIWSFPPALESVLTLHANDQLDLDLTLARGRIAVTNTKDRPANIRLRFANPTNPSKSEIWDLSLLEKGTEVIVNLAGVLSPGEPFDTKKDDSLRSGPTAVLVMLAHSGAASIKIDLQPVEKLVPPPAGSIVVWNSRVGKASLAKVEAMPPWAVPVPPLPKDFDSKPRAAVQAALAGFNIDLGGQAMETGLIKAMSSNDVQKRRLAVRSAGAIDDLQRVIDALEDKEVEVRQTAIQTLFFWAGSDRDNSYKLYQQLQRAYSPDDSQIIMTLLQRWSPEEDKTSRVRDTLVGYLTHKKVAVRELAHNYLLTLNPAGAKIGYNAAAPDFAQRAKDWQKLVQQAK